MKIIQLEYFCAVARYHSITQAAQKLYVTQPAISSAIRALEKEFSVNLFSRTKNHISLTKEGELFYQKASELLTVINQASEEFHDLGMQIAPLRIGIPPLLSTIFFPGMYKSFQEEHPDIPVKLLEYGSIRAAQLVREDQLDLAIVNLNFYEAEKLEFAEILSDRVILCVSPEHHLAKEKKVTLDMLKDEPLIMYNTDSVQNATLEARFERLNIKPNIILHASQLYTIRHFVSQGLAGAFLYSSLMQNMQGLISIPITPIIRQEIGLIWKKGKFINTSAEKFITFTKKYAEKNIRVE